MLVMMVVMMASMVVVVMVVMVALLMLLVVALIMVMRMVMTTRVSHYPWFRLDKAPHTNTHKLSLFCFCARFGCETFENNRFRCGLGPVIYAHTQSITNSKTLSCLNAMAETRFQRTMRFFDHGLVPVRKATKKCLNRLAATRVTKQTIVAFTVWFWLEARQHKQAPTIGCAFAQAGREAFKTNNN